MSSNIHPTKPLGGTVNWKGGAGNWDTMLNNGAWYSETGFFNSYPENVPKSCVFDGTTGTVTVSSTVYSSGILLEAPYDLIGGTIHFPSNATITANSGFPHIFSNITGAPTLTLNGSALRLYLQPNTLQGRNINLSTHVIINSSTNVYLNGALTGAGTLEITGGGHIIVNGLDAGARSFSNPSGFTGMIITPDLNSAPVITSATGSSGIPLYAQEGVANTYAISATDADGDVITYGVDSPSSGTTSVNSSSGVVTYTPTSGYEGLDQFNISAADGYGGFTQKTVFYQVFPHYDIYVNQDGHQGAGSTTVSGVLKIGASYNPSYKVLDRVFSGSGEIKVYGEGVGITVCMDSINTSFSGKITLVKGASVFVGDSIRREWIGIGINHGSLGTATLSVNWNEGFNWFNFPGTTTIPNNTTDEGGTGAGGYLSFGQGTYNLTGTIGHSGYTSWADPV